MLANLLTTARLLLIVPVVALITQSVEAASWWLPVLVLAAIASDYFDGIVARKSGTASARGMLFDHSTDFLFVTTGLFAIASQDQITVWLPILIVVAFSQYVLDSYFLFRQKQLRMSFLGRWNGIFYFSPLLLFAFAEALGWTLVEVLPLLGWALVLTTLASIFDRLLAPLRQGKQH